MATAPPPPPPNDPYPRVPGEPGTAYSDTVVEEGYAPPPGPPVDPDARNRIGWGMLFAILVLAAIAAVLAAIFLTRHHHHKAQPAQTVVVTTVQTKTQVAPASIPVPSLVGLAKADALTQLRRAGFKVSLVTVAGSPPAGRVLAQDPGAGLKEPSGSTVRLNISNGAAGTPKTTTAAVTTTAAATTAVARTTPAAPATTAAAATTTAAATTPAAPATTAPAATTPAAPATTAAAPTTTAAAAPAAPANASVPTLNGDMRSAIDSVAQAGFPVTLAYVPSTQPLGTVVSQSPSAGTSEPTTAHITINVSEGPGKNSPETIPDLSGKTVQQALSALHSVGLRLVEQKRYITDKSQIGKVVEQTPAAGKTAPKNADVLIYWGAYRAP